MYYEHLLIYVLFLRILTQDKITNETLAASRILIKKFINDFEQLYGSINVSFNVHSHLHLPDQVERFGPLNKISCFAFEGFFKVCSGLFQGTRNICHQIAYNLNINCQI